MSNVPQKQEGGGNLAQLQNLLEKHKGQIANALPKHMTPERMIRVALSAVSGSYLLMKCRPISLAASIVQSSILGLEPNSLLGEAYLVPFWNKHADNGPGQKKGAYDCQLMPGYLGLVKLARNSGQLAMIDAQPVHELDTFDFSKGSDTWWTHTWPKTGQRGRILGYWAGYVLKDGSKNFEYWTTESIEAHRDKYSKGAHDDVGNLQGPWLTAPDWMYRKTVLKQLIKLMPKSVELATALALDERAEAGVVQAFIDVPLQIQPPVEEHELIEAPKPVVEEKPEAAAKNGNLTPKQQERIMALCAEHKWNEKRLMGLVGALGYERLADVPAAKLDEILAEIGGGAQ